MQKRQKHRHRHRISFLEHLIIEIILFIFDLSMHIMLDMSFFLTSAITNSLPSYELWMVKSI